MTEFGNKCPLQKPDFSINSDKASIVMHTSLLKTLNDLNNFTDQQHCSNLDCTKVFPISISIPFADNKQTVFVSMIKSSMDRYFVCQIHLMTFF